MKKKNKNVTKYGEVVCSEFEWLPIEKQKENDDKLANITQKRNKEKNKSDHSFYKIVCIIYFI